MLRWRLVTSGVCQGSIMKPVLSNTLISDTDSGIECILSKFDDDFMLSGAGDMTEGRNIIQSYRDRLEKCTYVRLLRFNKAKHKVLPLGWGDSRYVYRLREELNESSFVKGLGGF